MKRNILTFALLIGAVLCLGQVGTAQAINPDGSTVISKNHQDVIMPSFEVENLTIQDVSMDNLNRIVGIHEASVICFNETSDYRFSMSDVANLAITPNSTTPPKIKDGLLPTIRWLTYSGGYGNQVWPMYRYKHALVA